MKTLEQLVAEAAERGFVPGAKITTVYGRTITISDPADWHTFDNSLFINGGAHAVYSAWHGKWGKVITPAPPKEEGLKERDAVECSSSMRTAILELAAELGLPVFNHGGGFIDGLRYTGEQIMTAGYTCTWAERNGNPLNVITPEAFIAKMRITATLPKPIKIASEGSEYPVHFFEGSIKVGCTTISNDIVRAIASKLIDKQK